MIVSKIPSGDSKWGVLLDLLSVYDIAFSPVMSTADTFLLEDAVETFLTSFTREFAVENLKPKMRFLLHYGSHCQCFQSIDSVLGFHV